MNYLKFTQFAYLIAGILFAFDSYSKWSKGENIVMGIKLTLEEIYLGVKKTFKYNRDVDCKSCDGHGGHGFNKCYKCDGSGIVIGVMETPFGSFHQPMNCDVCNGSGISYWSDGIYNSCMKCCFLCNDKKRLFKVA